MPHRRPLPHPHDWLIAGAGLSVGLVMWFLDLYSHTGWTVRNELVAGGALVAVCVAAVLRRTAQPWAVLLAFAAVVADQWSGSLLVTIVLFSDLVYAAVLYGSPRVSRAVLWSSVIGTVVAAVVPLALLRKPEALLLGAVVGLVAVGAAATGMLVRGHRDTADAERLRAEQTALLAERDRVQAVNGERARMARELHDMVANHLSAIALHATAAQSARDPELTEQALGVIRENSVQGMTEMRRLITLLRDAGASADPDAAPTLDGLPSLLAKAEADGRPRGLRFVLRTGDGSASARGGTGRDAGAVDDPLPSPVELAAYRIVQESLTNALKHAAPGEVRVRVVREGGLAITVTSPLGHRPGPALPSGAGAGIVGMRERVALLGGEFEAGPTAVGWRVRALLPVGPAGRRDRGGRGTGGPRDGRTERGEDGGRGARESGGA